MRVVSLVFRHATTPGNFVALVTGERATRSRLPMLAIPCKRRTLLDAVRRAIDEDSKEPRKRASRARARARAVETRLYQGGAKNSGMPLTWHKFSVVGSNRRFDSTIASASTTTRRR